MIQNKPTALVRSFAWSLTGDLASKVAIGITTLIVIRALDPLQFGRYIGLSAVALLAAAIWDLGLATLLTREIASGGVSSRSSFPQLIRLRTRTLVLWLLTFGIGVLALSHGHAIPPAVIAVFAGGSLLYGIHALLLAILKAKFDFRGASVAMGSGRWFTTLTATGAALYGSPSTHFVGLAWAFFAGEAVTLLIAAKLVVGLVDSDEAKAPAHLSIRRALPFGANGVMSVAYNRFDVVILSALSTSQQLGYYAPASRIQDALYLIPASVGSLALPLAAATWHQDLGPAPLRNLVSRITVLGTALALPAALGIFIFTPQIIAAAIGSSYLGATTPTRILLWSMPISVIGASLLAALAGTGHATDTTKAFAVALLVAVILHLSLDWWWGATGAAVASLTRDGANLVTAAFWVRKRGILRTSDMRALSQASVTVS